MTIDNELALEFLRKAEHDLGSARLSVAEEKVTIESVPVTFIENGG